VLLGQLLDEHGLLLVALGKTIEDHRAVTFVARRRKVERKTLEAPGDAGVVEHCVLVARTKLPTGLDNHDLGLVPVCGRILESTLSSYASTLSDNLLAVLVLKAAPSGVCLLLYMRYAKCKCV